MDATTDPSTVITCAKPGCAELTTLCEAIYVDGYGLICPGCAGPLPEWWDDIEPPY